MKRTIEKIINYFIPDHIDKFIEDLGQRFLDKSLYFISIQLVFLTVTLVITTIYQLSGGPAKNLIIQVFLASLMVFSLFLFKKSKYVHLSLSFPFLLALIYLPIRALEHGQIMSPAPIWYIVVPGIAFYFLGLKYGMMAFILFIVESIISSLILKGGFNFTPSESVFLISIYSCSVIFSVFIVILIRLNEKWDNDLKDRIIQESYSAHLTSLGEMSGTLAHEINNPLAVIKGNAQSILKGLRENADLEILEGKAQKILNHSDRVGEIVLALSEMSKKSPENPSTIGAHFKLSFEPFYNLIKERVKTSGLELEYEPEDLNIVLPCHPEVLTLSLLTLFNNSIQSVSSEANPWIKISIKTYPNKISLYFTDSGKGIEKKLAARLFEPFFTTKNKEDGRGISLSLVKNKLIQEGALIRYDYSSANTTFVIDFPTENL